MRIRDCQSLRLLEESKQDKRNSCSLSKLNARGWNSWSMSCALVPQDLTLPVSIPSEWFAYWHLRDEVAFAFGRCIWYHVFFAVSLFLWHVKVISVEEGASVNFPRKGFWAWTICWIVNVLLVWKLLVVLFFLPPCLLFKFILVSLPMKLAGVKWKGSSFCIVVLQYL